LAKGRIAKNLSPLVAVNRFIQSWPPI